MGGVPLVQRVDAPRLGAWREWTTDGGLRIIAVQRDCATLSALWVLIPLMRVRAPGPAAGSLLAAAIADAVSERMDAGGIAFDAGEHGGWLTLVAAAPADALPTALEAIAVALAAKRFDEETIAWLGSAGARAAERVAATPSGVARARFTRALYGTHPFAALEPEPAGFDGLDASALGEIAASSIGARGSVAVIVGPLDPARSSSIVARALGALPDLAAPAFPPVEAPRAGVVLVDRPGSVQTMIVAGGSAPQPGHPDEPAFSLVHDAFGGGSTSRLGATLRERHGYAYSPFSSVEDLTGASQFTAVVPVSTDVTAAALEVIWDEARTVQVDPAELADRALASTGRMVRATHTVEGLGREVADGARRGTAPDELVRRAERIAEVTTDDSARASAWLDPERWATVLVGDAQAVEPQLEAAGITCQVEPP